MLTFSDITELKASAHEIDNARRFAEAIVETIRQPLLVLDANLRVQSSNRVFTELFRVEVNQTVGSLIYDLGNGQWNIPELRRRLEETISENHAFNDVEIERDFEKIGERSMLLNGRKLVQADGQTSLILLAIEDVTERKAARAHQDVLVGELNHRVKNVMATVQAVATQTLSNATSLENARTAFSARLFAMASAHDLLTHEGWAGTELGAVVKATIDPHTGGKNRFAVKGPNVCVQARSALSVAMALHELSTNAAQYGALSVKNGHVDIVWRAEGDKDNRRLHFIWSESGGRLIKPPDKKGFGSRLVEKALAAELNAKVSISYKT